ncbi:methylisocitrate lyase [Suttonella sp. R2A3]|uniref:methylisocitrate lyase n=1 Tax=Suttonella sp. R2A3 TaxID=2908648 RepID=UPI001F42D516|nr:methylisocitrate lyase [Suttonella sp. R2A3]UJF23789.1 methylisocitrate lyase [Suttonella sp. R2A3]
MHTPSAGKRFREAIEREKPLQIMGAINAYSARLAQAAGYQAIYLSGGGVAACSLGVPDLGITTLNDVLIDAKRITGVVDTPLLVDIDTGWGGAFNIARAIRELTQAGVAAVHMEDQIGQKRCGHRPNKALVSTEEMCDRVKAAVDAKTDPDFVLMARTDAYNNEGLDAAIARAQAYIEAGADMIFAEAMASLDEYRRFAEAIDKPLLANITEFGKTPLFSRDELASVGVAMVLYPLSAFRAASLATERVYAEIRAQGTQEHLLDTMQTRDALYERLNYHAFEQQLDRINQQK